MSDDKKIKYEFDTRLPSMKTKKVDAKSKGNLFPTDMAYRDDISPVMDKQNVVTRIIDHLKERF